MTIIAKYPGKCSKCGKAISIGSKIEWEKGRGTSHLLCAQSTGTPASSIPATGGPWAGASGGVRHEKGVTRRAGSCERCGEYLRAGQGRLEYCVEDSGCMRHHDEGGYHVYCLDADACSRRRQESKAAAQQAKDLAARATEALKTILALTAAVAAAPAWWIQGSKPIARWSKPVMIHTGAYPQLYVSPDGGQVLYYVPGYFACDWDTPAVLQLGSITAEQRQMLDAAIDLGRQAQILDAK